MSEDSERAAKSLGASRAMHRECFFTVKNLSEENVRLHELVRHLASRSCTIEDEFHGTVPCVHSCEQDMYEGLSFEQRRLLEEVVG